MFLGATVTYMYIRTRQFIKFNPEDTASLAPTSMLRSLKDSKELIPSTCRKQNRYERVHCDQGNSIPSRRSFAPLPLLVGKLALSLILGQSYKYLRYIIAGAAVFAIVSLLT